MFIKKEKKEIERAVSTLCHSICANHVYTMQIPRVTLIRLLETRKQYKKIISNIPKKYLLKIYPQYPPQVGAPGS